MQQIAFIYLIYFVSVYTLHTILAFNLIYIYPSLLLNAHLHHYFFSSRLLLSILYRFFLSTSESSSHVLHLSRSIYFLLQDNLIHCTVINSIILVMYVDIFLDAGSCLWCLVGLLLEYLELKSPQTLNSSDECPGLCMGQVILDIYLL